MRVTLRPEAPRPQLATLKPPLPLVFFVHPSDAGARLLHATIAGRGEVVLSPSVTAANAARLSEAPSVAVLSQRAPGGWDAALIQRWRAAGIRVVLLGPPQDVREMSLAFSLGADDFAGGLHELAVRVLRWLPRASDESVDDEATCDTVEEAFAFGEAG